MKPIASLVAAAALLFAAGASAADYCVAPNTTCGGQNVATLEEAFQGADIWTDSDRIFLGATTYVAPADGFQYNDAGLRPTEIIGAGIGKTIITSPPGATAPALVVTAGPTRIHDLTLKLPANAPANYSALETSQLADHIEVSEDPQQSGSRNGVALLDGGQLQASSITLSVEGATAGVWNANRSSSMSVRDSTIEARTAVEATGSTTVTGSRLTGVFPLFAATGTTHVSHTLLTGAGSYWVGIAVGVQSIADTVLDADGVVINGFGEGTTVGVQASTHLAPGRNIDVALTNVVVRDAAHAISAYAHGSGHAHVDVSYSDLAPTTVVDGAGAAVNASNVTDLGDAAGFVDPAAGDFHLKPGSPLIDAGNPNSVAATSDLDGNPVDVDGNGDGIGRRDIGVFEWQLPLVDPTGGGGGGSGGGVGDAGGSGSSGSGDGGGSVGGAGFGDPSQPAGVVPPPAADGFIARPPAGDVSAPVLSRLSVRAPRLSFRLSEAANVRVTLQKRANGRWRPVIQLSRNATAGVNRIRFLRRALAHGRYRVLVEARDAAGNRAQPRTLSFRS